MKSIYLFPFLFVLASATLGVHVVLKDTPDLVMFTCLGINYVTLSILEISDAQGNLHTEAFLANYIASKKAQIKNIDAIVRVNDTFPPEDVCNGVARALPSKFNGTVWLDVDNQPGLWSLDVDDRISYLEELVKECQHHGLKPGVSSEFNAWSDVMGSRGAGSDILKAVPVRYENEDDYPGFYDFHYAVFGTWEIPTMKNYQKNDITLCNYSANVISLNYF